MTDAVCNAWYADNWLPVIQGNRLWKVRAKRVIFATGAVEQPAVFRNNDLPGVMLGTAAQRLIRLYGVRPGTRAVVLAGNDTTYGVALDLADAGVAVAAIADLRLQPPDGQLRRAAKDRGLAILDGQVVREALPARGHRHVRGIVIGPPDGTEQTIDGDLVCMSVGFTPAYHLPLQAGAKLGYDDGSATFSLDDLPDTVQLAGAVNGDFSLYASGERSTGVNHPWPIFPHPKGKEFVDFDEDLQVHDIRDAVADGYRELELVKRFSTVGMGPSQGRQSALTTARLVAEATGRTVAEVGVTTARPPVFGEKLGVLAGRSFEPERRTPMHHRHMEAGAQMMPVGLWWRPAFYGAEADRDDRIVEEARTVRENVGLIDVSTLGGLDIRGPDAAEFLNRVYTFAYAKQPVGRARCVLMTNEAVIDDGVACRLAEDHFYVTATTGPGPPRQSTAPCSGGTPSGAWTWTSPTSRLRTPASTSPAPAPARSSRRWSKASIFRPRPFPTWACVKAMLPASRHGCSASASSASWATRSTSRRARARRSGTPSWTPANSLASAPSASRRSACCGWKRATSSSARTPTP